MEKAYEKSAAIRSMVERWQNLPPLLTEIKKSKGHTVQTLADGTGVSADRLGKFLRGKLDSIRVDEIEAVCIFLDISLDALLGNMSGSGSDERVRELEIEIRFLTERLAAAEKVEQKDAMIMEQFDKMMKSHSRFIFALLVLLAIVVLALLFI